MLFASFDFLLFILPVLAIWWLLVERPVARTVFIVLASYFFYAASSKPPSGALPPHWAFAGLLVFSTFLDYFVSNRIHALDPGLDDPNTAERARRQRNAWLTVSLVGNLGLLGYFKYTNFFIEAFVDVANAFGAGWVAPHLDLILPIGISFYTFQTLSYTIDVWRRQLTPERDFLRFAMFVVFFPQLVAGPIVRASEFLPQLHQRKTLTRTEVDEALFRIFKGLVKKVVLGDWIAASFTDVVFDTPQDYTSLENLLALYGFTLQIYADFSGYSDIAIGTARLLGFTIPENFDRPYQARNLGEFWRRWHMTLSTWLRDYLFFPLGGSKGSSGRTYFNLWLTMFLVGMWHGASWNFVIYSNLHGAAMVFNRWNRERRKEPGGTGWRIAEVALAAVVLGLVAAYLGEAVLQLPASSAYGLGGASAVMLIVVCALPEKGGRVLAFFQILLTFHFTVLSRVFFRAEDLEVARTMCRKIVEFEWLGVRPGLFRVQGFVNWVTPHLETAPAAVRTAVLGVAEWGILIVLALGIAFHFTPRAWIDVRVKGLFTRLPAPVVGILYALLGLLLMKLLDGPRANIYFAF